MGISLFIGEAEEGRLDQVLQDANSGQLQPMYDFIADLPTIENQPVPVLPPGQVEQFRAGRYENNISFDLGRGCPFQCSFCSIINVHGRKSRFRSASDFEKILRRLNDDGINRIFITDDNFARNKNWKDLFDCLIELRNKEDIKFSMALQVDMLSHKNPLFIEMAIKAGVYMLFVGLETINAKNLLDMKKGQNNIDNYRTMLLAWKKHPVVIMAGYITGLPDDTKEGILHDIETLKQELPVDLIGLSYLTPLPGSEDHRNVVDSGVWVDPDMNKYDLTHRVVHHPKMSDTEWEEAYEEAYASFYSAEHIEVILKRAAALGSDLKMTTATCLLIAKYNVKYFGIRTFDGGLARIRHRNERRHGLPKESFLRFHYKDLKERLIAKVGLSYHYFNFWLYTRRLWKDPKRFEYMDKAIASVQQEPQGPKKERAPIRSREVA